MLVVMLALGRRVFLAPVFERALAPEMAEKVALLSAPPARALVLQAPSSIRHRFHGAVRRRADLRRAVRRDPRLRLHRDHRRQPARCSTSASRRRRGAASTSAGPPCWPALDSPQHARRRRCSIGAQYLVSTARSCRAAQRSACCTSASTSGFVDRMRSTCCSTWSWCWWCRSSSRSSCCIFMAGARLASLRSLGELRSSAAPGGDFTPRGRMRRGRAFGARCCALEDAPIDHINLRYETLAREVERRPARAGARAAGRATARRGCSRSPSSSASARAAPRSAATTASSPRSARRSSLHPGRGADALVPAGLREPAAGADPGPCRRSW